MRCCCVYFWWLLDLGVVWLLRYYWWLFCLVCDLRDLCVVWLLGLGCLLDWVFYVFVDCGAYVVIEVDDAVVLVIAIAVVIVVTALARACECRRVCVRHVPAVYWGHCADAWVYCGAHHDLRW